MKRHYIQLLVLKLHICYKILALSQVNVALITNTTYRIYFIRYLLSGVKWLPTTEES